MTFPTDSKYKGWKRWVEENKHFPRPKYGFTQHLKHIGDKLITHPITEADYIRFKDAAKFWAWFHDKRIRTKKNRLPDGMCFVEVTLIAHNRESNDISYRTPRGRKKSTQAT